MYGMKRVAGFILAAAILLSLAGCGSGETAKEQEPEAEAGTVETAAPEITQPPEETTQPVKEITFREMTAYEDENCKIQITGLQPEGNGAFSINLSMENKLTDHSLGVDLTSLMVNGVCFDPYGVDVGYRFYFGDPNSDFTCEIPAAGSVDASLEFRYYERILEKVGEFSDIAFELRIWDPEDSSFESETETPAIHIYPYGEDNAVTASRDDLPTDYVILDNEKGRVIVTGYEQDDWCYYLHLYVENRTEDQGLYITTDWATKINGEPIRDGFSFAVKPGSCGYSAIEWWMDDLQEAGIEQVETIDLSLHAWTYDPEKGSYYSTGWSEDINVELNP